MKGSLQVKNGKYYAVLAYKDENGKDTRKWISTGLEEKGNKRKAEAKLNEILQEYNNGNLLEVKTNRTNDMLFGDYLKQWLLTRKNDVEEDTYQGYQFSIKRLSEFFDKKNIYLQDLKPYDLQSFYNLLYSEGKSGNTAVHYHVIMREALKEAVRLNLVDKNVADLVDRPKKVKYETNFYNKNELQKLFEVVKGDPLELIVYITAYYGLRRSEVVGLKWSAIDFENKIIKINHKVVPIKGKLIAKNKMKNKSSNRTLPLIPQIEQMLLDEKSKQEQNRILYGNSYNKNYLDYVCVNSLGELIKPEFLSHHFKLIQRKHGLKEIRFHDLRHSCASLMLANGVQMKQIQEWLGHSTFNTTADTYAHLDYSSKLSSANTISNALSFEEQEITNADQQEIDKEIAELERMLEEKRKLKKKKDFEM